MGLTLFHLQSWSSRNSGERLHWRSWDLSSLSDLSEFSFWPCRAETWLLWARALSSLNLRSDTLGFFSILLYYFILLFKRFSHITLADLYFQPQLSRRFCVRLDPFYRASLPLREAYVFLHFAVGLYLLHLGLSAGSTAWKCRVIKPHLTKKKLNWTVW